MLLNLSGTREPDSHVVDQMVDGHRAPYGRVLQAGVDNLGLRTALDDGQYLTPVPREHHAEASKEFGVAPNLLQGPGK